MPFPSSIPGLEEASSPTGPWSRCGDAKTVTPAYRKHRENSRSVSDKFASPRLPIFLQLFEPLGAYE